MGSRAANRWTQPGFRFLRDGWSLTSDNLKQKKEKKKKANFAILGKEINVKLVAKGAKAAS